jgi:sugar phosphate permease
MSMAQSEHPHQPSTLRRYLQLAVIVVAAGAIYPLIYLRQNFEVSILESFGITLTELSQCYSSLGVIFVLSYVPSGWLADRVPPRWLVSLSLAMTGALGLWFSTMPSFPELRIIFAGWGIATGLTFWSAHIKAVTLLAKHDEQGRFFGILDGGRGLVEALLATIAVAWFAHAIQTQSQAVDLALQQVIYLYVSVLLVLAPLVFFVLDDNLDDNNGEDPVNPDTAEQHSFWVDLKVVLARREIWLCAVCIVCGYQMFWATYSFSGYMQQNYGMTAVAVGTITVAKLWMRPIGAAAAGFACDFLDRELVLALLMVAAACALAGMAFLPVSAGTVALLSVVLLVGILTYAVRGIYWATLDSCGMPVRIKGLAIGVISLIGYSPDIYLPLISAELIERYPGKTGYSIYFLGLAVLGLLGAVAAWRLRVIVASNTLANRV